MAATRVHKQRLIRDYKSLLDRCTSLFILKNHGLTVQNSKDIRKKLTDIKARVCIVKNSLMKISIQGTVFQVIEKYLKGPTALVFSKDPITTAKALAQYITVMPCELAAALVEGTLTEDLAFLTKMFSGPEFYAKIFTLLNHASFKVVKLLNVSEQKLLRVLTIHAQSITQIQEKK